LGRLGKLIYLIKRDKVIMEEWPLYRSFHWLKKKYCDENLTSREIAKECSVDHSTILKYIHRFGFQPHVAGNQPRESEYRITYFELPDYLYTGLKSYCKKNRKFMVTVVKKLILEFLLKERQKIF